MIVWKGLGILGILLPFIFGALLQFFFPENSWFPVLGYVVGSIPFWFFGRKLNANFVPDPNLDAFGNWITKDHSAFFIPMEYWTLIYFFTGIPSLTNISYGFLNFDRGLQIFAMYLGSVLLYFLYLKIRKPASYDKHVKPMFEKDSKSEKPTEPSGSSKINNSNKSPEHKESFQNPTAAKENLRNFENSDHGRFLPKSNKDSSSTDSIV